MKTKETLSIERLAELAQSRKSSNVDMIMAYLNESQTLANCKKIDYVLSLIDCRNMRLRLKHYLFNGTEIQRNYAALYFKRRGSTEILKEAVHQRCIDEKQAFSR